MATLFVCHRGDRGGDCGIVAGHSAGGAGKTARGLDAWEKEPPAALARPVARTLRNFQRLNALVGDTYLIRSLTRGPVTLNAINLNISNLTFLLLGSCSTSTGPAYARGSSRCARRSGLILQSPFYAGIGAIITSTALSQQIAHAFVGNSNRRCFEVHLGGSSPSAYLGEALANLVQSILDAADPRNISTPRA